MILRVYCSFPLPIFVLFFCASLTGQQNSDPFNPVGRTNPTPRKAAAKEADDDKIKQFNAEMSRIQTDYAQMVTREKALQDVIRQLASEKKINDLAKKHGDADEGLKERIRELEANAKSLQNRLAVLMEENRRLKAAINELQTSSSQAKDVAEKAVNQRNEMHQALFEELLNSDDAVQQELALVHFFTCADKYEQGRQFPVNIYTPDLLRRIGLLVDSDSEKVKQLASKCMFTYSPEMAANRGIQFGPNWRPLEFYRASLNTRRILSALEQDCPIECEETPLGEILEEMQMRYRIPVRIHSDVDPELIVTFESKTRNLATTLAGLLTKYDLDYATVDEQIVVMKKSNPDLQVNRTYNVRGLLGDQGDMAKVLEVVQQSVGSSEIKLTPVSDYVLVAKTTESNQRRVQKQLGTMAPQAKWYSH